MPVVRVGVEGGGGLVGVGEGHPAHQGQVKPAVLDGRAERIVPVQLAEQPPAVFLDVLVLVVAVQPFRSRISTVGLGFAEPGLPAPVGFRAIGGNINNAAELHDDKLHPGR